jgi:hypothetical protein
VCIVNINVAVVPEIVRLCIMSDIVISSSNIIFKSGSQGNACSSVECGVYNGIQSRVEIPSGSVPVNLNIFQQVNSVLLSG